MQFSLNQCLVKEMDLQLGNQAISVGRNGKRQHRQHDNRRVAEQGPSLIANSRRRRRRCITLLRIATASPGRPPV